MKAVIFGGGNIGRGLIAPVLIDAEYEITVVDANLELVDQLNSEKRFEVLHTDGNVEKIEVAAAVPAQDEEAVVEAVSQANLITTAVGGAILPIIASPIRDGLNRNEHPAVNVIACENTHPNSALLKEAIGNGLKRENVGFPEVVVDRIVVPAEGLDVSVEASFEFFVDSHEWVGDDPPTGIQLVDDVDAYLTRKLWLVNGLHAVVAFQGLQRGYNFVHEAIADPAISADVGEIASNMVKVLAARHPQMSPEHLEGTASATLHRFADSSIADDLKRVARNPLQKLGGEERVLGPAQGAAEAGLPLAAHGRAIAAAFSVTNQPDVAGVDLLATALQSKGWSELMQDQGIDTDGPVAAATAEAMDANDSAGDATVTESITILNPSGLHARPASAIVEHVKTVDAKVTIQKGEKVANAASILSVLTLGASTGDEVVVSGEGPAASEAVSFIKEVLIDEEGE